MKIIMSAFMLALVGYFYSLANIQLPGMAPWKLEHVLNKDGSPSKFDLMRSGIKLQIHAEHRMGDGSIRYTIIEDSDGDNKPDRAHVVGVFEENEKMYYNRENGAGLKFYAEWKQEWDESVYQIEKLLGRSIRAVDAPKIP